MTNFKLVESKKMATGTVEMYFDKHKNNSDRDCWWVIDKRTDNKDRQKSRYFDSLKNALKSYKKRTVSNTDRILKAIQKDTGKKVILLHDEASGYVFKTDENIWEVKTYSNINNMAGLGYFNGSMLD